MSATVAAPPQAARTDGRQRSALVLCWSQTGQLRRAAESLVEPLERAGWRVVREELEPAEPYPFPWPLRSFLGVFPEAVGGPAPRLAPLGVDPSERFDLVIVAYQVWFLSPAPPVRALVTGPGRPLLDDARVVTLVGCRNMWYSAAREMRTLLRDAGARHVANVVLTDDGPAWATFVTTPRWLLTGRRDRFLGLPPAGASDAAIRGMARIGEWLARDEGDHPLSGVQTAPRQRDLALADLVGRRAFGPWAAVIRALSRPGTPRRLALTGAFGAWLVAVVPIAVPALAVLRRLGARFVDPPLDRALDDLEPGRGRPARARA